MLLIDETDPVPDTVDVIRDVLELLDVIVWDKDPLLVEETVPRDVLVALCFIERVIVGDPVDVLLER